MEIFFVLDFSKTDQCIYCSTSVAHIFLWRIACKRKGKKNNQNCSQSFYVSFNNGSWCALFSPRWICVSDWQSTSINIWMLWFRCASIEYAMYRWTIEEKKNQSETNIVDNNLINDNSIKYVNNVQFDKMYIDQKCG